MENVQDARTAGRVREPGRWKGSYPCEAGWSRRHGFPCSVQLSSSASEGSGARTLGGAWEGGWSYGVSFSRPGMSGTRMEVTGQRIHTYGDESLLPWHELKEGGGKEREKEASDDKAEAESACCAGVA